MGEATCVMHAFSSYPSGISNEAQEEGSMYTLEESVSLGRFMTESLSWEKWSSFSRNRYVEEAEMYSRPGSVKQKKAYFEAHFKKMAALKAAALLEQANSVQGGAQVHNNDDHVQDLVPSSPSSIIVKQSPELEPEVHNDDHSDICVQDPVMNSPSSIMDQQWIEKEDENASEFESEVHNDEHEIDDHTDLSEQDCFPTVLPNDMNSGFVAETNDGDDQLRCEVIDEKDQDEQDEFTEIFMDVEEQNPSTETISELAKVQESYLEVEVFHECIVDKDDVDSGFVADQNEDDQVVKKDYPSSTKIIEETDEAEQVKSKEQLMDSKKQNPSTDMETSLVQRDESRLECSSIYQDTTKATTPRSKRNPILSAFIPSSPKSKRNPKLYMSSLDAAASSLVPSSSPAAVHPGKENSYTPIGRKSWIDEPEKKRTPLRMSFNRELNRLISPVIKKIGSSTKASNKDFSTPLKTPSKLSEDSMTSDPPEITPQSGKRRARALFDSAGCGGSKAGGQRWQFLSTEGSKSSSGGRNKTSSPIIPKSFCLSTSRAPRRKERLEEKFNAKATESIEQQSKLKEKPKEPAKLRNSFCFGAKLSSESFREREREKDRLVEVSTEKSKGADCKGRRSRLQNMSSLPPRKAMAPKGTNSTKSVK